jgi:hypothetical protein
MIVVASSYTNLRRAVGRPWWMTTARVDRNPFDFTGDDYCSTCHEIVDTDTEAHHRGTQYVYRKRCLRCGHVIAWGSFDNVPLLSRAPIAAVHWAMKPGQDRR